MVVMCTLARAPRAKPSKKSSTSSLCRSPTRRFFTLVLTTQDTRPLRSTAATAQGLIHGHQKVSRAQDAFLVAQRLVEGLAQRNADVFHRVVLVDIQIAVACADSRSKAPCRVNSSSMWSKKRMPVLTL